MSKVRSPRYPQIGLKEAIDRVRAVYEADHTNTIPKEVVAQHMGYRSLNGASLGIVSAVSKYGLLEGGAAGMKVTDRALAILAGEPGNSDRSDAIRDAARQPDLFKEIFELYPQGVSDQSLKSFLLARKKFLPAAAEVAIRAFRSTEELVKAEGAEHHSFSAPPPPVRRPADTPQEIQVDTGYRQAPQAVASPPVSEPAAPYISVSEGVVRLSGTITNQSQADYVIGLLSAVKPFLSAVPKDPPSAPEKAPGDGPDGPSHLG